MYNLLESIISEDYVSASEIFESRIQEIVEQKLLETKRSIAARQMNEVGPERPTIAQQRASGRTVRASDPIEKGGFGLSPYDQRLVNQSKIDKTAEKTKRLRRASEPSDTKKPTGQLKAVPKPEGLKAKRDRLLIKARELDKRGVDPFKSREGAVKAAYLGAKFKKAASHPAIKAAKNFGGDVLKGLAGLYEEENN